MALAKNVNVLFGGGTTGTDWVWDLINLLVGSAGWKKLRDSDGTTYSSSGAQVTGSGTGARGLRNASAWVNLQSPDGKFNVTIQRSTSSNLTWRVKVSPNDFTGGSPSATQTPSATNESIVLGGGTDASPTFAQWIGESDAGGYRGSFVAETTSPFRVLAFAFDPASGVNIHTKFALDVVQAFLAAGDTFPWVVHCAGGASGADMMDATVLLDPTTAQGAPFSWLGNPGTGTFGRVPALEQVGDSAGAVAPDGGSMNPITSTWDLKPLVYERRSGASAPHGLKGYSSMFFWRPASTHATGDLYNVASTGDCVLLNQVVANLWGGDTLTGASGSTNHGAARLLLPATVDSTAPVVSNVTPAAGTLLSTTSTVQFDVTDDSGSFRELLVVASFGDGSLAPELVHDGTNFLGPYRAGSTRVAITNGWRYALVRGGGWPGAVTVTPYAIDPSGNINT